MLTASTRSLASLRDAVAAIERRGGAAPAEALAFRGGEQTPVPSVAAGWGPAGPHLARGVLHEWIGTDDDPPLLVMVHLARAALADAPPGARVLWIGRRTWPHPQALVAAALEEASPPEPSQSGPSQSGPSPSGSAPVPPASRGAGGDAPSGGMGGGAGGSADRASGSWEQTAAHACAPRGVMRVPLAPAGDGDDDHGWDPFEADAGGATAACDLALLERSVLVDPRDAATRLWAIELALRSRAVAAVVADGRGLDFAATRRLQLAAASSRALVLVARAAREQRSRSAAAARWRVRPADADEGARGDATRTPAWHSAAHRRADIRGDAGRGAEHAGASHDAPRWIVKVLRCKGASVMRGGAAARLVEASEAGHLSLPDASASTADAWLLEWDRAALRLRVPPELAHRSNRASSPAAMSWPAAVGDDRFLTRAVGIAGLLRPGDARGRDVDVGRFRAVGDAGDAGRGRDRGAEAGGGVDRGIDIGLGLDHGGAVRHRAGAGRGAPPWGAAAGVGDGNGVGEAVGAIDAPRGFGIGAGGVERRGGGAADPAGARDARDPPRRDVLPRRADGGRAARDDRRCRPRAAVGGAVVRSA